MRRLMCFFTMGLLLVGCPESPGPDGPGAGGPAGPGGAGAPPEGGPGGGSGEGRPNDAKFDVKEGEGVTLSGTVSYAGEATGPVRMDFLVQDDGNAPRLVHASSVETMGAWSIVVPKGYGDLFIVGFLDPDADGPSPTDPAASVSLKVEEEDIGDLELVLVDDPDLGSLTPGTPPSAGGEAPKDGAPPQDGPPEGAEAGPEGEPEDAPPAE